MQSVALFTSRPPAECVKSVIVVVRSSSRIDGSQSAYFTPPAAPIPTELMIPCRLSRGKLELIRMGNAQNWPSFLRLINLSEIQKVRKLGGTLSEVLAGFGAGISLRIRLPYLPLQFTANHFSCSERSFLLTPVESGAFTVVYWEGERQLQPRLLATGFRSRLTLSRSPFTVATACPIPSVTSDRTVPNGSAIRLWPAWSRPCWSPV